MSQLQTPMKQPVPRLSPSALPIFMCAALVAYSCGAAVTNTNSEPELIAVLQSKASLQEKDAACARLKWIGTAKSVPALAALLRDPDLSHSARNALESMNLAAAGRALTDSLKDTTGTTKAGIINSLAARGEVAAAPALIGALKDPDAQVASSAAAALGQLGAPAGYRALFAHLKKSSGPVHVAEVDALLRWGYRLLANSKEAKARDLFEELYDTEKADAVRVAAFRGLIQASANDASDKGGLQLMLRAIPGPPGPGQVAALQSIRDFPGRAATEALCQLLPQLDPALQPAVAGGLSQRDDPSAIQALNALASSPVPDVRLAALRALDRLGDATSIPVLGEYAASGSVEEQRAARQALNDLRRGNITEGLIDQLSSTGPAVQAELARTLGDRGDHSAVPRLFTLAQNGPPAVSTSAFRALGELAANEDLSELTRMVLDTKQDDTRSEAARALRTACQHIHGRTGRVDLTPVVRGLRGGSPEARIALFPVCSAFVAPELRLGLRAGLQDSDPRVRDAAIHALCDTVDAEMLEDIVAIARAEHRDNFRVLAINGGIRVATQEETVKISNGQRIGVLNGLLASAARPEEKRLVLSGLAEVSDMDSLRVVENLLSQDGVQNEACRAALKIAVALPSGDAHDAMAVLNKALAATNDEATRQAITAALAQIQASADYLTDWQVAGPYRQTGRDYKALFDILFPPELENAQGVTWQPLPAGTDPKRPWVMDLLKPLGGQECVAYARTWVHCDQDVTARLELGTDDGVKVWLNDKQVHANNVSRAMRPGSDKVEVNLHSGWNRLLLKITQHNQGWEFCARLLKPDGSPVEGLRCESAPRT